MKNVDRATLVRKWILSKIKEHKLEKAAEKYQKGLISVEEGAKVACTTIWKFIEYIREKGISTLSLNTSGRLAAKLETTVAKCS